MKTFARPQSIVGRLVLATWLCLTAAVTMAAQELAREMEFNIPSQRLADAILKFSEQTRVQVVTLGSNVSGLESPGVAGKHKVEDALRLMLKGTGLTFNSIGGNTVSLIQVSTDASVRNAVNLAQADQVMQKVQAPKTEEQNEEKRSSNADTAGADSGRNPDSSKETKAATAEILVKGRRTLNMDIQRTENDAQPYVIVTGDEIRRSGATNVEDFLRTRLPMNATGGGSTGNQQIPSGMAASSQTFVTLGRINLRGLKADETLILVDGRRLPGMQLGYSLNQPYISNISPSSIERIEILSSTASGQYGGGATGGVINIVLKRDYDGLSLEGRYGSTGESGWDNKALDLNGGFNIAGGRVRVLFSGSHSEESELNSEERDFAARATRQHIANFPTSFALAGGLIVGPRANILSTGGNLVLDPAYGGTALNSPWAFVPAGYAGPASDNAAGLRANAGQLSLGGTPLSLRGARENNALSMDLRADIANRVEGYLAVSADRSSTIFTQAGLIGVTLAASSPNNPFQQNIQVILPLWQSGLKSRYGSEVESARANAGLIADLPFGWRGVLDHAWSSSQSSGPFITASVNSFDPATSAALQSAALTDVAAFPFNASLFRTRAVTSPRSTELQLTSLRFSGPALTLPGGEVTTTVALEHAAEDADDAITSTLDQSFGNSYSWTPAASQQRDSAFLELRLPLVSEKNRLPLLEQLELSAAGRYDSYENKYGRPSLSIPGPNGPFPNPEIQSREYESDDYSLGLRYSPSVDLTLRASYATGFVAPRLPDLIFSENPGTIPFFETATDPRRGGSPIANLPVLQRSGGNPNVRPELSESSSYGVILTPRLIEGLRVSADITETRKTDEIVGLSYQVILNNDVLYADRIRRGPNLPSDPPGWAGPVVFLDTTSVNAVYSNVKALDIQFDYTRASETFGEWRFYALATKLLDHEILASAESTPIRSIGFYTGLVEWRGNAGIDWTDGPWSLGWNAQYIDKLSLCSSFESLAQCDAGTTVRAQGSRTLPSEFYHDVHVQYRFADGGPALLAGAEITLGIQNLFDKSPEILANSSAGYSFLGDPRMRRFALTLRKRFDF